MPEPGAAAPDFTLRDPGGGTFRFAEENAKRPVLLLFWSIFCEPCRLDLPLLQKVHDRHKDGGLAVIAIDLDGEPLRSSVAGFLRQEGYTFRVLIDELEDRVTFKAADPFGVAWIPTLFLVERGGKVAFSRTGRIREEDLEKAVQLLLKK
jgi:thiol-disulfide isomerase/thioredoxin